MVKILLIALGGGLLMGLTPAPNSLWYLAWIALVPLWVLLSQQKKLNILIPLAWGIGYQGLAIFWITGIHPMTWLGVSWWNSLAIAIFCWIFLTLWGSSLVVIWGIGLYYLPRITDSSLVKILAATTLWCVLESLWSLTPLWWTSLAYTQSPANLIILQLGKLSGPTTIAASILLVNGLLAEAYLRNLSKKLLTVAVILVLTLHGLGFWLYQAPDTAVQVKPLNVGIIQGNIPNQIKLFSQGWYKAITGYSAGYQALARRGVDIILTPETALPFFDNRRDRASENFYQVILQEKIPIWLGTFTQQNNRFRNSLLTITSSGEIYSIYDKVHLVPLGEYIPLENIFGKWINRLSPLEALLVPGKVNQLLDTPFGRVAVGICYDSAFAEHFRRQTAQGAQAIISAANNAHYSSAMPSQHHAQDVMRAIESDRYLARATNTGYSAIIDNRGHTLWLSGLNTYKIYNHLIYLRQTKTLYVLWGDWLTKLLLVLTIILYYFFLQKYSHC